MEGEVQGLQIGLDAAAWSAAREGWRTRFGQELYDRWLAAISLLDFAADEVTLGAPNAFVVQWLETKYLDGMRETLVEAVGRSVSVKVRVDPELFQQLRREQQRACPYGSPRAQIDASLDALPGGRVRTPDGDVDPDGRWGVPSRSSEDCAPQSTFETFIVGACNELAHSAVSEVLREPGRAYNPLFVHGSSGVGKTHLLRALYQALLDRPAAARQLPMQDAYAAQPKSLGIPLRARFVNAERYLNHFVASVQDGSLTRFRERYRSLDVLIMDDVHLLAAKKKTQLELLHTFDALVDAGKQVVFASEAMPRDIAGLDPSLGGRLMSGLTVRLLRPDCATRRTIVETHTARRRMRVAAEVLDLLTEKFSGSVRDLVGAVVQLDLHARVRRQPLNVEEAGEILSPRLRRQSARRSLAEIHQLVARHFDLSPDLLLSSARQRQVVFARQVAMYAARRYAGKSLAEVGKYFGNRNHTTVRSAEIKVARMLESPHGTRAQEVLSFLDAIEGLGSSAGQAVAGI